MHYYHDYFLNSVGHMWPLLQCLLWSAEGAVYTSVRIVGKAFYRSIIYMCVCVRVCIWLCSLTTTKKKTL